MIARDRFSIPKTNFYDMNFNRLDLRIGNPNFEGPVKRPDNLGEMIDIAKKLSSGFRHIRVDLYDVKGKIYFGEMTFFHWGGISVIEPQEWDTKLGNWIILDRNLACTATSDRTTYEGSTPDDT